MRRSRSRLEAAKVTRSARVLKVTDSSTTTARSRRTCGKREISLSSVPPTRRSRAFHREVATHLWKARDLLVGGTLDSERRVDIELEEHWRICKIQRLHQNGMQLADPAHFPPAAQHTRCASRVQRGMRARLEFERPRLSGGGEERFEVALHIVEVRGAPHLLRHPPLLGAAGPADPCS